MAPSIPRIAVIGSINIDLVSYVARAPGPGETLTSNSFAVSTGGKGANQAVACAKLSRSQASPQKDAAAHVSMVGAVGDDSYGATLRTSLAAYGVDVIGIEERKGMNTGVAVIVVEEPTGQNRIIVSPNANNALQPDDFSQGLTAKVAGPSPDLIIMQLEIPLATTLAAAAAAKQAGVPVLLNPAPAQKLPLDVYDGLTHLVVNETEAALLAEVDVQVLDTESGLAEVAAGFVAKGVENVLITLGGRGVYYLAKQSGKKGLVPAEKAKVVDTTAAGDTFVGQYALEVVGGAFDIEAAVRKANRAAAKTVERLGAQDSIPWRDELQ